MFPVAHFEILPNEKDSTKTWRKRVLTRHCINVDDVVDHLVAYEIKSWLYRRTENIDFFTEDSRRVLVVSNLDEYQQVEVLNRLLDHLHPTK